MNWFIRILLVAGLSIIQAHSHDTAPIQTEHYHATYGASYEKLYLPGKEEMGLLGFDLLFDINRFIYGGVALYGAIEGRRGGFFTVGIDSGLKYDLGENIRLRSGLFVGAGGGGGAPQGGGLLLRPYLQTSWHTDDWSIGVGISHIEFPNGAISSTQGYAKIEIPTEGVFVGKHLFDRVTRYDGDFNHSNLSDLSMSFLAEHYIPESSSTNTDGTPTTPYSLAGIRIDKLISRSLYGYLHAAGAGGGHSDGYMELFAGGGYLYRLGELPVSIGLEAAIGAGGGGRVDTGGGLLYRVQALAEADVTEHIQLKLAVGKTKSATGSFSGTNYGITLGYRTDIATALDSKGLVLSPYPWRFRLLNKSYLNGKNMFKTPKGVERVDLLGLGFDWYLNPHIYLTGQSYWAYKGKAGGYAEGIVGVGYQTAKYHNLSGYIELKGGVGGGGSVNIGGGMFGAVGGGVIYDIDEQWSLTAGMDYMRNKSGTFKTKALKLGIGYCFSLLEKP